MVSVGSSEPEDNTATTCASWLKNRIEKASSSSVEYTMFKVPNSLKQVDINAFEPHIVSIGPYNWHRRQNELQEMEHCKLLLLQQVFKRDSIKCTLEACINLMQNLEDDVRKCYKLRRSIKIKSHEYVEMLLLDSFFILECFYVSDGENCMINMQGHPIFNQRGVSPLIQRDLLMLENQLPLFVLIKLFALVQEKKSEADAFDELAKLAINFFNSVIPGLCFDAGSSPSKGYPLHLLGLVRWGLVPEKVSFPTSKDKKIRFLTYKFLEKQLKDLEHGSSEAADCNVRLLEPEMMMHSVSKVRGAGVRIVKEDLQKDKKKKFTAIKFEKRNLYIPPLKINDATRYIFLNLMAFEQCHPYHRRCVTSYVSFMDTLINTSKDVEYLKAKGIIDHDFGSDQEVANLFNTIRKEIFLDPTDYYLYEVSYELSRCTKKKWSYWCSTLKQEYFINPWKIISIVAAAVLMLLTIAQTIFSLLEYRDTP